jgi:metal-responsive CopG/Arc/MetJ family transcriptional regulator
MPRLSVTLPAEILSAIKKEAKQKDIPISALVRLVLAQRAWRKNRTKDKQHWLEAIYAGKARRKIKEFEDWFSD